MYLSIDHNSGVSISAQISDQIKYLVVSGALQAGEQIPSVRELARRLKLNPTTVARIYRRLEAEEIIYTQAGRGTFITRERSGLTAAEKRRRLSGKVRDLVVECGRIGMDYADLLKLVDEEIRKIEGSASGGTSE
ncbi:MAG: GntR family transcriptional regulator [Lentisphaerae bacterium]|nr:GntR family transcriptional regulator [Lentisphaerota bacterium]MBT5612687.1 GntR family transcriptional regulator [Lentisphaerota bacterium]MBT7057561.1 GntR family transcriptional regulator [Lentisphaerota bacterium]MBT7846156.1 GntR family transcriptional regulator [Lentisphaerota bacterium]